MLRRALTKTSASLCLLLSACGLVERCSGPQALEQADFDALYALPPGAVEAPLHVYHLGHSLVGRDMPAMLAQLAGEGHDYTSQLGWGATMREHWEPDIAVAGYAEENTHRQHRDPHEALAGASVDALVVTEAVEIRDAIRYQDSAKYLGFWAGAAWEANPAARVYLYETWHPLDGEEDWLTRLDRDLALYWEGAILRVALSAQDALRPIYMIPGGQVMAAFVREVEASGGIGPIRSRDDLFADNIHFNDYGAYLMALTHYAVLYGRSPIGLPHALLTSDGNPAGDPGPEAAGAMQRVVWDVVTSYPPSGVALR